MSESKNITYRNLAGLALGPINERIQSLIGWGAFDKYILEMASTNREPRDILPGFNWQYRKMALWVILISMAVTGAIFESFLFSAAIPLLACVVFAIRYRELVDRLQVIGRIPEVRNAIYHSVDYLHKDNSKSPGYDTNYAQPLLVDYFKKRKTLTGKEFFNIYLELAQACGPAVNNVNIKKHEFAELLGIDDSEEIDEQPYGLEILADEPVSDNELVNAVNQFKANMAKQKPIKTKPNVNKKKPNPSDEIKESLAKVSAAIASVNSAKVVDKPISNEKPAELEKSTDNIEPIKLEKTENPPEPVETESSADINSDIKKVDDPVTEIPANKEDVSDKKDEDTNNIQDDINPDLGSVDILDFDEYDAPEVDEFGGPDEEEDSELPDIDDQNIDDLIDEFNQQQED